MIVARDLNNGIGKDNNLPWKCKEDLKWFKECTTSCTVVMGRNTFDSLGGKPLPKRTNIVITTTPETYSGKESSHLLFMTLSTYLKEHHKETHWLIGGSALYKTLMPYVNEVYVTTIEDSHECDAFLDIDFTKNFNEINQFKLTDNAYVTTYWKKDDK